MGGEHSVLGFGLGGVSTTDKDRPHGRAGGARGRWLKVVGSPVLS
jgi:hypothetical protein